MKPKSIPNARRRLFLRRVAGVAVVGAAAATGQDFLSPAVAGGPPLREASVNSFIAGMRGNKQTFSRHALLARQNLRAYVLQHFTLTPRQQQALRALTPQDIQKVQQAVATAEAKNLPLHVRFIPRRKAQLELASAETPVVSDALDQHAISIDLGPVRVGIEGHISPFDVTITISGDC